jgi:diphthamide synthase subunit DPH2
VWADIALIVGVSLGAMMVWARRYQLGTERFIDSLQGLIEDAHSKVFLIVDNLRVHHAKQVRQWVEERQDRTMCPRIRQRPTRTNG